MICRYSRRSQFLQTGLAAAQGDHEGAAARRHSRRHRRRWPTPLTRSPTSPTSTRTCSPTPGFCARPRCATTTCMRDRSRCGSRYSRPSTAPPPRRRRRERIHRSPPDRRRHRIRPILRRDRAGCPKPSPGCVAPAPGPRHEGWELATARTQLERAAASWSTGDHVTTEQLIDEAYPVIARYARAHDVSRCWLYLGLTRLASGALEAADECWENAETALARTR